MRIPELLETVTATWSVWCGVVCCGVVWCSVVWCALVSCASLFLFARGGGDLDSTHSKGMPTCRRACGPL